MPDRAWPADISSLRRLAFRALRGAARAARAAAHACDWLATGVVTAADLRAARDREWRPFNATDEEVDAGLLGWEQRFYGGALVPGERVLLIGCGAGRDLIALRGLEISVDGLESCAPLVADARRHLDRRGMTATVTVGSIEDTSPGPYDVYVFSYFCYTYIRGAAARGRALASIRGASPHARVLISAPVLPAVGRAGTALTNLAAAFSRSDWRAEAGDVFEIDEVTGIVRYRHGFGEGEIEREVRNAAFRLSRTTIADDIRLIEAVAD